MLHAGIELRPSTLIVFGNPPLGVELLTSKSAAGLDWPVRLLVTMDAQGQVLAMYTDFAWIARRHGIENRDRNLRWLPKSLPRSSPASRRSSAVA